MNYKFYLFLPFCNITKRPCSTPHCVKLQNVGWVPALSTKVQNYRMSKPQGSVKLQNTFGIKLLIRRQFLRGLSKPLSNGLPDE